MRSLLVAAFLFAVPLHGQLSETLEVNVLELDAVVLDRAGRPVEGLTREDFEVQLGGRATTISNFYAVKRGAIVDDRSEPAARESLTGETSIPTSLTIFVDDTRLSPRAKQRAIEALKQYVREHVGPNTSAMIVRWNGSLNVRTRPTERAGPLLAELEKMAQEPAMHQGSERRQVLQGINDAFIGLTGTSRAQRVENMWRDVISYVEQESHAVDKTIDALREMVRLTGGFEGRRSLLYVSEGLPLSVGAEVFDYWERSTRAIDAGTNSHVQEIGRKIYNTLGVARYDRSRAYQQLARAAQTANVAFYAVDAGGVRGYAGRGAEEFRGIAVFDSLLTRTNDQDGVRMVAVESGGRFISEENDLGRALSVLSEQFTTWYSLGVRAPASTRLKRVRISVKGRPDLRVTTARQRGAMTRDEDLQRSVRSRLYNQRTENPLDAAVSLGAPSSVASQCVVPMQLTVARPPVPVTNGNSAMELYFALLDDQFHESDVRSTVVAAENGQVLHALSLGLKRGKYVLSLALSDPASGETSFLQRQIDASVCP